MDGRSPTSKPNNVSPLIGRDVVPNERGAVRNLVLDGEGDTRNQENAAHSKQAKGSESSIVGG